MALSTNCWKYLVLTFNVLFAMSAVVLFGLSGFLIYRLFIYRHFLGVGVQYPAVLLLMMAIITCSVAWIGWRTAKSMHQIHVIVTGVLIALVVVIEFAVFVWAMVEWDNIEIDVKTTMTSYFMETNVNKQPNSADAVRWDRLHVRFECCGVTGPSDYSSSGHMPFSCCGQGPLDSLHKPYTADCATLYQRGCANQLHQYARQQLLWVALTALAASMLQMIVPPGDALRRAGWAWEDLIAGLLDGVEHGYLLHVLPVARHQGEATSVRPFYPQGVHLRSTRRLPAGRPNGPCPYPAQVLVDLVRSHK